MQTRDIVVVGGSAGALPALRRILRDLPARFPAALFVVIHTAPDSAGNLPAILAKAGPLPAEAGTDGARIRPGRIYVAPPDHHLLLGPDRIHVTRGPRENRFRPAVDPLFRSAATVYGPRVLGIILSGGGDDGALGLSHIKRRGGIVIVQTPDEAETPSMPRNAIRQVAVDHVLRVEDMPAIVAGLVREAIGEEGVVGVEPSTRGAADERLTALRSGALTGPPSPFTCPECGGTLWELRDGDLVRFQCHVGHGFNSDSLVAAQSDELETALWTALRTLEESAALRRRLAERAKQRGMSTIAASYDQDADHTEARADVIRRILVADPSDAALTAAPPPAGQQRDGRDDDVTPDTSD